METAIIPNQKLSRNFCLDKDPFYNSLHQDAANKPCHFDRCHINIHPNALFVTVKLFIH